MNAGIKSWSRIVTVTPEHTLTDQRSQKEQVGAFAPAQPSQNECSFCGISVKPTAPSRSHGCTNRRVLARGRPSTSSTTVTISTHATTHAGSNSPNHANPSENFFSLNAGATVQVGGASAPPNSGRQGRYRADREALSEQRSGEGARTPSPASHQVGVSGGGLDHRVTPTWCEAAREVIADV